MKRCAFWCVVLIALFSSSVEAATLFGRVIEVNDGDVITVFNLNRPVRVKLMGVDAPEADQAFGDVAKKHLSELVFDKSVLVEYWGIAADGSLVGRVTLDKADIGAQMIRDGAAWFDAGNQGRLSADDREVYQQSEHAARNERRGLWQAADPIAPWEFVKAKMLKTTPAAASVSVNKPAVKAPNRPVPELTNLTLIAARMNSAAASSSAASSVPGGTSVPAWTAPPADRSVVPDTSWAMDASEKEWRLFKPAGENFSADMPAGGKHVKMPLAGGSGTVDLNLYLVRDGSSIYEMMWMTAPSLGETDKAALDEALGGFMHGVGQGFQNSGGGSFSCASESEKGLSIAGYTGRDFDLSSCTIPGKLRVFTKVIDGQRQMYVGAAFSPQGDPNIERFFRSFTVKSSATPKSRTTKR